MDLRSRSSTLLWVGLSLAMFAVAAFLTGRITAVNGHAPLQPDSVDGLFRTQSVMVLQAPDSGALSQPPVITIEGIDGQADAGLTINLPANANVKIIFDNLAPGATCASPRSANEVFDQDAGKTGIHLAMEKFEDDNQNPEYIVTPEPADFAYHVHCLVKLDPEQVTYVRRKMTISTSMIHAFLTERQKALLGNYALVPSVVMQLSLDGSDRIDFSQSMETAQTVKYAGASLVPQGTVFHVEWTNIYAEQMRDIILIVVGSLIAIGVTMLIEAVRPFVDAIGRPNQTSQTDAKPPEG